MANKISEKLAESWKKLPNSLNGNGQNFIFLLKTILGDLKEELDSKFEEISKISSSVTDAPEEIDEQLQNCKIQEVRVGTNISFVLTWDYSNVKNYDSAEIYIKETKGDITNHKNWDEVEVSRTIRTTKTDTVTVDGINAGYIYQITFQAKNTFGSVSRKSGCPVLQYAVSAMNNVPDPPLEFDVYFSRDGVLWRWKQPANLDYAYSELRTNQDVGNKVGLLEVTQDTKSTVLPPTREGTAYLYNKGYGSKYSTPLTKPWSKPIPMSPQVFKAEKTFRGILFTYSKIPEDCIGIVISINGEKHYTQDDTWTYYCSMGNFVVKACYYDIFGEGIWTEESTVAVYTEIDPDWLKDESITLEKVDATIKDAVKDAQDSVGKINTINGSIAQLEKTDASITSTVAENKREQDDQNATFVSQIKQNSDSITSVVTSVAETNEKVDSNYSAILQNQKDIALRVKSDDIINQINISKEGVRIDGNKVHITGDTVFDKGVIVSSYIGDKQIVGTKIADGAIETDKLSANSVTAGKIATNAVTADKVEAGAITTDKIATGAVTADSIGAGAVTADKLTSGAVTADKLAANEIKMAGALKVVGGNVTLDEKGMTVKETNGSSVLFGESGMSFIDSKGQVFSGIGRFCTGVANDGDTIKFASAWDIVPSVFLFAQKFQTSAVGYSNVNIYQVVYPTQVTKEGFKVVCKSVLGAGSNNSLSLNKKVSSLVFSNEGSYNGWNPSYNKGWNSYSIKIPTSATSITISFSGIAKWAEWGGSSHTGKHYTGVGASIYIKILVDGEERQGEFLFLSASGEHSIEHISGTKSESKNMTFSLSGNTQITLCSRFVLSTHGSHNPTVKDQEQASVTINSITSDTNIDTVIARGTAGFIAIDPNSCPYTVIGG